MEPSSKLTPDTVKSPEATTSPGWVPVVCPSSPASKYICAEVIEPVPRVETSRGVKPDRRMGLFTRKPWARVCWVALGAAPPSCDVPAEHEAQLCPTSSATSTTTATATRGIDASTVFIFSIVCV